MAVSKVTLFVLVATVAVSLSTAKSVESGSMDYAHQLLMDMTSGGYEPKAVGPASQSFGRALFGQKDAYDDQARQGLELFRSDQTFETVAKREPRESLNIAQQDAAFGGQESGKDVNYVEEILLERESDDFEF